MALIIKEEPGCECNIGRAVTVSGPIIDLPGYGPTWLIEPASLEPWSVLEYRDGSVWTRPITFSDLIEHPDAWLLPLRPADEFDWLAQNETHKRVIKLGEGTLIEISHAATGR